MNGNTDRKGVVEKIVDKSRESFIGSTPLIAIDTYEIELMEKVVRSFDGVDFKWLDEKARKKGVTKYLCAKDAATAINFPKSITEINRFISSDNILPFKGMVQIVDYNNEEKNEIAFGEALRDYVHKYVNCHDESNHIRNSVIFLYGDIHAIPKDLIEKYTNIIDVDYPETWERVQIVRDEIEKHRVIEKMELTDPSFNRDDVDLKKAINDIAVELAGFSLTECEKNIRHMIKKGKNTQSGNYFIFDPDARHEFIFEKKELMLKSLGNIMTLSKPKKPDADNNQESNTDNHKSVVEGFGNYDDWIGEISEQMNYKRNFTLERGIGSLRGILICGVPGCGKSESVSLLGPKWNLNILRLDVGSMMEKYVGNSERNLRKCLRCAEIMSPVILFCDEIDKGFSNLKSGSGSDGNAVTRRMFGYLLSWMQDNKKEVFVCATANDISGFPSEFFRSGRFDALFCTYMPSAAECVEIFREQMKRNEQNKIDEAKEQNAAVIPPKNFRFSLEKPVNKNEKDTLAEALAEVVGTAGELGKFLTGADIKKIIEHTLRTAKDDVFADGFDLKKWKEALIKTLKSPNMITYGFSTTNRDTIATTYVRLMRQKFIPVSKEPIFDYNKYDVDYDDENGKKVRAKYTGDYQSRNSSSGNETLAFLDAYDEKLFDIIKKKIDFFADMVEESEAKKATS